MKIKKTRIGIPAVLFLFIAALGYTIWYCHRPIAQPKKIPTTYEIRNTGQRDIIIGGDTIRSSDTGWGGYSIHHTLYFNPHVAHPTLFELEDSAIRIGGASIYVPPSCTNLKYHKTVILYVDNKDSIISEAFGLQKDGIVDTARIHTIIFTKPVSFYNGKYHRIIKGHAKSSHTLNRNPLLIDSTFWLPDSTSEFWFQENKATFQFNKGKYIGYSVAGQYFDCTGPRGDSVLSDFWHAIWRLADSIKKQ